jgi:predicted nuclease of predicted toxin-antitoxin system
MRFKVDENLPIELAERLRRAEHDAATVLDQQLEGTSDSNLAHACQQEERILITLDLDFADIRAYPPQEYPGLIVLRLEQQDRLHVLQVFERLLNALEVGTAERSLWIVDEHRIRIRQ